MDLDLLTGVLGALPEGSPIAGLVILLVLGMRREAQAEARHRAELERQATAYDEDATQLRAENQRVREQRDRAETKLREHWCPAPPSVAGGWALDDPPTWPGRHAAR